MNKNQFASTPPMGWNSYDYYDTTVNEKQIKANADFMAAHLKDYGWEYIVVDIEWYSYDAGTQRDKHQYIPFWKVEIDEYSRLLPCPDRFPSSTEGRGFKPLADYIHGLGLKFGIHIMRGIPRAAAHNHGGILGSDKTANQIADPASICFWNPDMYGLNPGEEGSQAYYNSLFELYAQWGVDFIKCDDICRMDMPSAKKEIEMLYHGIEHCGRPMVLSLSPGPAKIEEAWHYATYSHMWRITDDFWDNWPLLRNMFDRCELWQNHVSPGCYPDCDMLPLGYLGKGFADEHRSHFTRDEQRSMMTLWCIFGSPLMLGAEMTKLDDWTLSLLTHKKVLNLLNLGKNSRQVKKTDGLALWLTEDKENKTFYLAVFNLQDQGGSVHLCSAEWGVGELHNRVLTELWTGERLTVEEGLAVDIPVHGVRLYELALGH